MKEESRTFRNRKLIKFIEQGGTFEEASCKFHLTVNQCKKIFQTRFDDKEEESKLRQTASILLDEYVSGKKIPASELKAVMGKWKILKRQYFWKQDDDTFAPAHVPNHPKHLLCQCRCGYMAYVNKNSLMRRGTKECVRCAGKTRAAKSKKIRKG